MSDVNEDIFSLNNGKLEMINVLIDENLMKLKIDYLRLILYI